jgi:hypothetical protein
MGIPTIPAGVIKVLPLGVGVPLIALIASVSPEGLASNLSKWYRHLGLGDPPSWLSDTYFDRKALVVLFSLAIVYAYLAYAYPLLCKLEQLLFPGRKFLIRYAALSVSVIVCFVVIFIGWRFWPSNLVNTVEVNKEAANPAVSAPPQIQKEKLVSRISKLILRCSSPLTAKARNLKSPELKNITKEVRTLLLVQDLSVSDTEVADVYKAQITPTASGPGTVGALLTSMVFEERRLNNDELIITEQINYSGLPGMLMTLATVPLDKDDDKNDQYVSGVEEIFTFPHGSCHLM